VRKDLHHRRRTSDQIQQEILAKRGWLLSFSWMVGATGLEPARVTSRGPKPRASAIPPRAQARAHQQCGYGATICFDSQGDPVGIVTLRPVHEWSESMCH